MVQLKTEKPILCLGDVNPDIILPYGESRQIMDAVARGEADVNSPRPEISVQGGGSVGNTASGLGRLGMPVFFAGMAGHDSFGQFIKEDFEKDGVDTRYLTLNPDIPTVIIMAVVGEDKNRVIYVYPPENPSHLQLRPQDLPDEIIPQIGWVHTTGFMLRDNPAADTVIGFMEKCAAAGILVSFDLNLRIETNPLTEEFQQRVMRIVNISNLLLGSGVEEYMPLTGKGDPEAAARSLVTPDRVVISRAGAAGVHYYTDEEEGFLPTFDVEVVDTVGAGDGFNAGFISAAARGLPLRDCVDWGNATACYTISHKGARTVPPREVIEKFMRDVPYIG
ncbi:carbohydrate kinase family protein [Bittarella massiliensis (ex Durand et al. 2017)]|uniref:carbohydrate kinase family protein n=1 Tax=Bittarella massiliensis (ex Durand et al. 2017) TaxID=1720313 RepID=UPI001AA1B6C9|nr:sugar kinase [Bittarella massiliensis (ex Durand et al. 2017)]MBO1678244.1 sugar kinase [Bittarella massiliensis (ex Durand et al. 2017)]